MGAYESHIQKARAHAQAGKLAAALTAIDAAIAARPEAVIKATRDAHLFRARLLQALGRPKDALAVIRSLDGPDASAGFLDMRAALEETLDLFEPAIATLNRLLPKAGKPAPILARRALLYQSLGQLDAAIGDLDAAISVNPHEGEIYRLRGGLVTMTADDPVWQKMQQADQALKPGSGAAVMLDFAMAKALEDLGDTDAAFDRLTRANRGMRALKPYDITARLAEVAAYRDAFGDVLPTADIAAKASNAAPIFITGMPRSGTTLIEHILSAHPDVTAGGEAAAFLPHLKRHVGDPASALTSPLDLSPAALHAAGHGYAKTMHDRFGPAPRHTDKTMQTLLFAGPVLSALPRAHIVLVRRNPHAIALSLFKQVFRPGKQLFSYDLDDIRAYQRSFDEMVEFWTPRLPARFHVVEYEDIVTDPEPQIRSLLDTVGLPFDPACLRPQDNTRAVRTLSAVAVRNPINRAALDGWRKYARHLGVADADATGNSDP